MLSILVGDDDSGPEDVEDDLDLECDAHFEMTFSALKSLPLWKKRKNKFFSELFD